MIFVTLGSQKFQFNRLLIAIDKLIENGVIREDVFAQIGYSTYKPRHYKYESFLDQNIFIELESKANIVITHGGTGSIMGAVKKGKKVIAVPRLEKYNEHVDDHQIQIIKQFDEMNLIYNCMDCANLENALREVEKKNYNSYISNTQSIIESIEKFIERI